MLHVGLFDNMVRKINSCISLIEFYTRTSGGLLEQQRHEKKKVVIKSWELIGKWITNTFCDRNHVYAGVVALVMMRLWRNGRRPLPTG